MELKVNKLLVEQAIRGKRMGIQEGYNELEIAYAGCYTVWLDFEVELNETTETGCVDECGWEEKITVSDPYIEITGISVFDIDGEEVDNVTYEQDFLKNLKDKLYYYL